MLIHYFSSKQLFKLHTQLNTDTVTLGNLPLCQVLLMNDSQYPWLILVPRREDVMEIYQLTRQDRQQLEIESNLISELLMTHFNGDKFNVAALGNVVEQLHIHHIVRFKTDPAWPKPVWGTLPTIAYTDAALNQRAHELTSLLKTQGIFSAC